MTTHIQVVLLVTQQLVTITIRFLSIPLNNLGFFKLWSGFGDIMLY